MGHSIQFGQTSMFSCTNEMNLSELEAWCSSGDLASLRIFKDFNDKFNYVSMLGNANPVYMKDWVKVIKPTAEELTANKDNWETTTNTCNGVTGYSIKVLTSSLGFESKLQNYVIGAQIEPVRQEWTFLNKQGDLNKKQSFLHTIHISFHEVLSKDLLTILKGESQFFLPTLPEDMFYPFSIAY